MKFHMIDMGYRQTPDYPYDFRIQLISCGFDERKQLTDWLAEFKIPHTAAGSVLYLRRQDATLFALRWA